MWYSLFLLCTPEFPESSEGNLGRTHLITHKIDTGEATPVNRRPYVYSPAIEKKLFAELDPFVEAQYNQQK
jgi:hypothetical protein